MHRDWQYYYFCGTLFKRIGMIGFGFRSLVLISFLILAFGGSLVAQNNITPTLKQQFDLRVVVDGLRMTGGSLRINLYDSDEGFPDNPNLAIASRIVPVDGEMVTVVFKGLNSGTYGIGVLHDEDENGKMSFSAFGLPKEGYTCSNNARGFMGPPKFSRAAFLLDADQMTHKMRIRY